MRYQNSIASH